MRIATLARLTHSEHFRVIKNTGEEGSEKHVAWNCQRVFYTHTDGRGKIRLYFSNTESTEDTECLFVNLSMGPVNCGLSFQKLSIVFSAIPSLVFSAEGGCSFPRSGVGRQPRWSDWRRRCAPSAQTGDVGRFIAVSRRESHTDARVFLFVFFLTKNKDYKQE